MVAAQQVGGAIAPHRNPSWVGIAISAGLGAGVALSDLLDLPGQGVLIALCCLAGLAAAYIAPGWRGLLAVIVGASATMTVIGAMTADTFGASAGFLMLLVVTPFAAFGALVGSLLRRIREVGFEASRRDPVVRVRLLLVAVIVIAAILYVATPS